jgi:endoglucanase
VTLPKVLDEILALPTAAFAESAVLEYVRRFCDNLPGVAVRADRCGNLLARYRRQPPRGVRPVVFTAHTDHPGFVALEARRGRNVRAAFRGWVEPEYFPGARMRFHSGGRWVRGVVRQVTRAAPIVGSPGRTGRPEEVLIETAGDVAAGSPGMWDLPEPALRRGLVLARACDDLAGCAAMLALLERLSRRRVAAEAYCLFTRAEEVGFVGAIGAARAGTIPRKLPVVAIETSKVLPGVEVGGGPILRVGDRASVFTPEVTAFCERVAKELAERTAGRQSPKRNRDSQTRGINDRGLGKGAARRATSGSSPGPFRFQRKLMDGGTCESTAYLSYGYPTTGVCLALGNYHNMDTQRKRIAPEYVSLADWQWMVEWFAALVTARPGFGVEAGLMRKSLDARFASYAGLLGSGVTVRKQE